MGVYDSFSLAGGIFSFIGDVLISITFGWRAAFVANAVFGVVIGIALVVVLPKETIREGFEVNRSKIRKVLLDRWLLVVGFSLLGLEFTSSLVANFMVFYLSIGLKEAALFSGVIASILPIAGITSSAFFGRIFDRTTRPKLLILSLGVLSSVGLVASAG